MNACDLTTSTLSGSTDSSSRPITPSCRRPSTESYLNSNTFNGSFDTLSTQSDVLTGITLRYSSFGS